MPNQTSFIWDRCPVHYEIRERKGVRFIFPIREVKPEKIRPLELNNALFRQFADTHNDEAKTIEFANAFGLLTTPPTEEEALSEWYVYSDRMRIAIERWVEGQKDEVCTIINDMKLSRLSLRIDVEDWNEPPVLRVSPASLIDAIWVQFAYAVSNNHQQKTCENCGVWFSYGRGTGRTAKSRFHNDRCRAKWHYYNPKKEKQK